MIKRVARLPERLLRRRVDRRGFTLETIAILLCGALGAIGTGYLGIEVWNTVENPLSNFAYAIVALTLQPVLLILGAWLVFAVTVHFTARFFGGRGPLVRVIRTSAWALIPLGIWLFIRSLIIIWLTIQAEIPAELGGFDIGQQLDEATAPVFEDPLFVFATLLGVLLLAWSWHLLAIGVEEAKNVSENAARRIAAVPVILVALYLVWIAIGWADIL